MKYCSDFKLKYQDKEFFKNIDEIWIKWTGNQDAFLQFIERHGDKRVIVKIPNEVLRETDIKFFENLEFKNFALCFSSLFSDVDILKVPYFFNVVANDWDVVNFCIEKKVSDIYIGNSLGFDLEDVAAVLHPLNIQIRCFPDVAQSVCNISDTLKTFFIRPDDVPHFEKFVDILEFYKEDCAELLYETYGVTRAWHENLGALITGLENIDNDCIDGTFMQIRTHCRKKCLKGKPCRACSRVREMANKLQEKNMILVEKEREE